MDILRAHVRDIPDFPKPGILFKDITPILQAPQAFKAAVDALITETRALQPDVICGIESRGFLFGAAMAYVLGIPFVPVRKAGKLPYKTLKESYALEYGSATLEIHEDAVSAAQRVLIVDDLLATGGTAEAAGHLIEKLGGSVVGFAFVIELEFLGGRQRLTQAPVCALLKY